MAHREPVTGGGYDDRTWTSLEELLDPQSAASAAFWPEYDRVLDQDLRLQDAGVAVIFKPFHEASETGSGGVRLIPRPTSSCSLCCSSGHSTRACTISSGGTPRTRKRGDSDADPVALVPASVDLIGIDVYDDPSATSITLASFKELGDDRTAHGR